MKPIDDNSHTDLLAALWYSDLCRSADGAIDWLWHGLLARGAVTLLTSQWKSGKTTLISVLAAKLAAGGTLAGRAVNAGRAIVVSEEHASVWARRGQRLAFGEHLCWICRPFHGKPTHEQWLGLIERIGELHDRHGLSLAVFDPLAMVLPGMDENNAGVMLSALTPLRQLTERGLAVILLHHPRKSSPSQPASPRGSGALPGFADILIELDRPPGANERRRRLRCTSRFEETPAVLSIELNSEGSDYFIPVDADPEAEEFSAGWQVLRMVLEDAEYKLTRKEVLAMWPADYDRPHRSTLVRWLAHAVANGLVCQQGAGRRRDPFRYWLVGRKNLRDDLVDLTALPPMESRSWFRLAREVLQRTTSELDR